MKIIIGSDHLGVELKNKVISYFKNKNIIIDEVTVINHETDDYTDFAFEVGEKLKDYDFGILICGNGIGMSIAANKVPGVFCARVLSEDDAFKCRNHNGANVIALSSEIEDKQTYKIIETFINTPYPTKERYLRRIYKMTEYERKNINGN